MGIHVCAGTMVYDMLRNNKRMNDMTICEFDVKIKWFLSKLKKPLLMTVAKIIMICDLPQVSHMRHVKIVPHYAFERHKIHRK